MTIGQPRQLRADQPWLLSKVQNNSCQRPFPLKKME